MEDPPAVIRSSFDLDAEDPARRGMRWHEAQNEFFFRHENGTVPDFRTGWFTGTETRDVRAATFGSDPTFCERVSSHVAKDAMDMYFVVAPTRGSITLVQRGREVELKPGSFSLVAIAGSHKYLQPGRAETHGVLLPGPVVRARRPDIDDHAARDFASAGALQNLFVDHIDSFCRNAAALDVRALKRTSEHLTDMLSLLIEGVDPGSDESTVQVMHRRRVQTIIEDNFRDHAFGMDMIVKALGLSERYVQKLFAANGETVGAAVRKRRLAEACRLLDRREGSRASIASVAYRAGFADPAHFSRVFRQHTGISPMEWALRG